MPTSPFDLSSLPRLLRQPLRWLAGLSPLETWYREWLSSPTGDALTFVRFALERLHCRDQITNPQALEAIPAKGPLVIVANHPLGGLEGLLLARALLPVRPDLKILTNRLLLRFPEFQDLFIGLDILGKDRRNRAALRSADHHLAQGGALLIFPAGTVGHWHARTDTIEDRPWHPTAARLALRHRAHCLPVHVEGRNARSFYLSGLIHPRLRTLLLPRALLGARARPVKLTLGSPFQLDEAGYSDAHSATDYLRLTTELTGRGASTDLASNGHPVSSVPAPTATDHLKPYELAREGSWVVYGAPHSALGPLADHLAAERENTFRQAGEGSGKPLDRDQFDPHYWHLIGWDEAAGRLIGAYRALPVREALAQGGRQALYSHSLFKLSDAFMPHLDGAIEVGRSFVTESYQRNPRALDLLWKGLGAFLQQRPEYHTFVGCVSISNHHAPLVKTLLQTTLLSGYRVAPDVQCLVRPHDRYRCTGLSLSAALIQQLSHASAVNKLFGHAGLDVRIPVLIRHYLALNGRFVDFTVNRSFSDSLDGLILVDLRQAPARYLKRYLGPEAAAQFLDRWSHRDAA